MDQFRLFDYYTQQSGMKPIIYKVQSKPKSVATVNSLLGAVWWKGFRLWDLLLSSNPKVTYRQVHDKTDRKREAVGGTKSPVQALTGCREGAAQFQAGVVMVLHPMGGMIISSPTLLNLRASCSPMTKVEVQLHCMSKMHCWVNRLQLAQVLMVNNKISVINSVGNEFT